MCEVSHFIVAQQEAQRAVFIVEKAKQERQQKVVQAEGEAAAASLISSCFIEIVLFEQSVCLSVCLFVCLCVCLSDCLSVCLSVCHICLNIKL